MVREDALALFEEIENQRYEAGDMMRPIFNVRLDAGTTQLGTDSYKQGSGTPLSKVEGYERRFSLFVRVDGACKPGDTRDHLRWVLERAQERGALATLQNAGIELR